MTSLSSLLSKSIKKKVNFKMIWEKGLFSWQMAVRVLQCQFNHFSSVFKCFSCEPKCLCRSAASLMGAEGWGHALWSRWPPPPSPARVILSDLGNHVIQHTLFRHQKRSMSTLFVTDSLLDWSVTYIIVFWSNNLNKETLWMGNSWTEKCLNF